MAVTMEQVLGEINRVEPNYEQAAQLGSEALPHLMVLVQGEDPRLAARATYLAAFIDVEETSQVLNVAAQSPNPIVRVAAAGSLRYLRTIPISLTASLLNDDEVGVRKWTLKAFETEVPVELRPGIQNLINNDPNIELRQLADQILNQSN